MRKTLIFTLCLTVCAAMSAQVTIEACYRQAKQNYPLIKQLDLLDKTADYTLENASKGYLPQLVLSGKASYQSDGTEIPINLSQIGIDGISLPHLSREQYGLTIDLNQTLWDGGHAHLRHGTDDAMVLSGLIFPVESMPEPLQWLSAIVPARWYIAAVRKIMIQGADAAYVAKEMAILAAMVCLLIALCLKTFKTRLN